jgi:hypothetical protein
MLSAYAVFSISMVVNQLSEALAASRPLVLWAIPIDFIGGAIGGLLIGHLADRAGRRKGPLLGGPHVQPRRPPGVINKGALAALPGMFFVASG